MVKKIKFWNDAWCDPQLSDTLNFPNDVSMHLSSTVSDFITNKHWNFPHQLLQMFPNLPQLVSNAIIQFGDKQDELLWKYSTSGDLQLKGSLQF